MAKEDDKYKEGVDFEWVLMKNQPKGGTNKTRRFFTKAEKEAMKAPKKAESKPAKSAPPKPASKPSPVSGASRSTAGKVVSKTNGVRPEGKAAGMPAAKKGVDKDTAAVAGAAAGSTRAAFSLGKGMGGGLKVPAKAAAKPAPKPASGVKAITQRPIPYDPKSSVARTGGGRAMGFPIRPRTGGGRIVKLPDILELKNMAKGGLVKKGKC